MTRATNPIREGERREAGGHLRVPERRRRGADREVRAGRVTIFALAVAAIVAQPFEARAQSPEIEALAPSSFNDSDLGRPVDASFQVLGSSLVSDPPRVVFPNELHRYHRDEMSTMEVRASVGVRQLGASASLATAEAQGYVRAVFIERTVSVPPGTVLRSADNVSAAYYISSISYGRLFERHFWGSRRDVTAAVNAVIHGVPVGVDGRVGQTNAQSRVLARGYRLTGPETGAFASDDPAQLAQNLRSEGPAVPVLVEYRRLSTPGASATLAGPVQVEMSIVGMTLGERPGVVNWDVTGNPDPAVRISVGGREICSLTAQEEPGWVRPSSAVPCTPFIYDPAGRTDVLVEWWEQDGGTSGSNDAAGTFRVTSLDNGQFTWSAAGGFNSLIEVRVQLRPLARPPIDQTYTGSLATSDTRNSTDGSFQDDYTVEVQRGWVITAVLTAPTFDPYVWILSPGQNSAVQLGSQPGAHVVTLTHTAETTGSFIVRANSNVAGQTGDYTLRITAGPRP